MCLCVCVLMCRTVVCTHQQTVIFALSFKWVKKELLDVDSIRYTR